MKLQDLLKDLELGKVYTDKDRKPFKVNEDGHTDVPSAIRKLKLSIEDSQELLQKLESMDKESSLLIFSNSPEDNSLDEIKEALISPLFFEHNFRKLFKIFLTKNILFFIINNKKKFFKFFVNPNF